ncbi:unnamed protein product [Aphanomyces euteiches]|uniref:Uncharacterized protein n=1 Tax=Aphanomyces euteiches TaxID=100861 RepID=A0A6G0WXC1_9STRA|nr:hypothetical protein Ae201684_010655 [Aphanomyces euteiches]KAH9090033.1 hypothetical protein Ae201684P_014788 [Aphanomyces euteiches]KAH9146575.1 hypothetical protein AeRB84_009560 [Aphanomyces euteiches]
MCTSPVALQVRSRKRGRVEHHVHFTTATTYLFAAAYGGSALPSESGPPIGLARRHFDTTSIKLDETRDMDDPYGIVYRFDHLERIALLKAAAYDVKDISEFCFDAIDVRKSRHDTIEQLKMKRQRTRRPRVYTSDDEDTSEDEA